MLSLQSTIGKLALIFPNWNSLLFFKHSLSGLSSYQKAVLKIQESFKNSVFTPLFNSKFYSVLDLLLNNGQLTV